VCCCCWWWWCCFCCWRWWRSSSPGNESRVPAPRHARGVTNSHICHVSACVLAAHLPGVPDPSNCVNGGSNCTFLLQLWPCWGPLGSPHLLLLQEKTVAPPSSRAPDVRGHLPTARVNHGWLGCWMCALLCLGPVLQQRGLLCCSRAAVASGLL
jgi:hypothetical protein